MGPILKSAGWNKRYFVYFLLLLFFTVGLVYKNWGLHLNRWNYQKSLPPSSSTSLKDQNGGSQTKNRSELACPVPQLNPYDDSVRSLLKYKLEVLGSCEGNKRYPLLFESLREEPAIVPVKEEEDFRKEGYVSCCYHILERSKDVENLEAKKPEAGVFSWDCFPLSLKYKTEIPDGHEFFAIYCKRPVGNRTEKLMDTHAFVHLKPRRNLNSSISSPSREEGGKEKLNVVIFGLDAVSRMSFLRNMPLTYNFLMEELGAVEMTGFNKVGKNTFPNLVPMLTSRKVDELSCLKSKKNFDDCPFIWKDFSKEGYYTSFSEDAPRYAIFNYLKPGFNKPPTDYYLRPISYWTEYIFHRQSRLPCYGPRSTLQFLLNYMEKYVHVLSQAKKNFFQLTWSTHLTHDDINILHLGDAPLLNSLKWLKGSGQLNKTVFILMSDHGIRGGQFRKTVQGGREDLLPFMFLVFPNSFKERYARAYRNLVDNRDKLLTTFDIHETLKDILHLERIHPPSLIQREADLELVGKDLPRGISRFLPIPPFRTCGMAGIVREFCSCTKWDPIPVDNKDVKDGAKMVVGDINDLLTPNPKCAHLQLETVIAAHVSANGTSSMSYSIHLQTKPGGAQFEAMIVKKAGGTFRNLLLEPMFGPSWGVQGDIDRTNWYGRQSHCAEENLKTYCFCKDLL